MTRPDITAMIVEDSVQTRQLIHMALNSAGITKVVEAENGAAAIAAIKANQANIAIMDWQMDVMDGLECTRRIRSGVQGIDQRLPIILLTGSVGPSSEAAAYSAGVDLFMEKPFSIRSLHEGVLKVLGHQGTSEACPSG